jgi:uridylate kinase
MNKTNVIKIGGSVISSTEEKLFDISAANKIIQTLEAYSANSKYILVIGGGALARKYQSFTREFTDDENLINWAGTSACNMNATMMRCLLGDKCEDRAVVDLQVSSKDKINSDKPFVCFGAADPGVSSDTDAVYAALKTDSTVIISLKNTDGVYDSDPKINSDAKRFDNLSWNDYRKNILKTEIFTPKMPVPVDPIASRMSEENKISFIIADGNDLENLKNIIEGKGFIGTTIS